MNDLLEIDLEVTELSFELVGQIQRPLEATSQIETELEFTFLGHVCSAV